MAIGAERERPCGDFGRVSGEISDVSAPPSLLEAPSAGEPAHFERQEPGRGRLAGSPLQIPWPGWRDILWRTWREISHDRLTVVAGSVTYFTLLAVFPALGVFVSLYGLVADVQAVGEQLAQLSTIFPRSVVDLLGEQMIRLATGRTGGLSLAFAVSLVFSLWSASAGMKALFDGLNTAYDETEKRGFLVRTAVTYGFTLALIAFIVLVSAILVGAPLLLAVLGIRDDLLTVARWPLVFLVAVAAFAAIYRHGPSRAPARCAGWFPGRRLRR